MQPDSRIYVAGHRGLAGSALVRRLETVGFRRLITRTRQELDLREQAAVERFFETERPEYVFLCAARVGGIWANSTYPAEFIYDNLAIQTNVIHAAWKYNVHKLQFLGSSCIYPKHAAQPMREEALLTGALEPTNQWYATAKIAGVQMMDAYRRQYGFRGISLMVTNLYGPGDNFEPARGHVLPALLRRFDEAARAGAPEVVVWGTGNPRREFLYVDDLAEAMIFLMQVYEGDGILNVGTGGGIRILELARLIAEVTGYRGNLVFDDSKPDGAPQKLLDVSRVNSLGWRALTDLPEGLERTYRWYRENRGRLPER
jgi:GDP-L-fucose synthase